ncbi:RcpC/CpaB family pilus assembly protein [Streptomyces sp. NPDC006516]|uniref:RcpC/CpaB family pilus assembly protein n=1 Tax=Streptomyces sp. NPDC006516 TaxID=3154309 RepID=UPI0033B41F66
MFPSVSDTRPVPPPPCGVPLFEPLRVRGGGGQRLRRALRGQRRALAAGFALASAVLAASGLGGDRGAAAVAGGAPPGPEPRTVRLVSAPVRIADAATVGLLRPGDRVDVIAAVDGDSEARVVARDVRVAEVPRQTRARGTYAAPDGEAIAGGGALVVLSVERKTATALAGAGVSGRLAVAVSHAE